MKFHIVDQASVVIRQRGQYRQVAVFRLGADLFAEYRKGVYVALLMNAGTSVPDVSWRDLDGPDYFAKEGAIKAVKTA